jgi:hypothetical protein
MAEATAVLSIVVGFASITGSFLIKQFYAGSSVGGVSSRKTRPVPRWQGRLTFFIVGTVFILLGLKSLFFGH